MKQYVHARALSVSVTVGPDRRRWQQCACVPHVDLRIREWIRRLRRCPSSYMRWAQSAKSDHFERPPSRAHGRKNLLIVQIALVLLPDVAPDLLSRDGDLERKVGSQEDRNYLQQKGYRLHYELPKTQSNPRRTTVVNAQ